MSIDDPEHLKMRAAEMRARAEDAELSETKKVLLRIADDFEMLAARSEQRLARLANLANNQSGMDGSAEVDRDIANEESSEGPDNSKS